MSTVYVAGDAICGEQLIIDNVHGSAQCITNVKYKIKPDSNNSYFNNGKKMGCSNT